MTTAIEPTAGSRSSYAPGLIAIHWITALVFVVIFASIELREYYPRGSEMRDFLKATHKSFGMLILLLALLRITLKSRNSTPPIVPPLPAWQTGLSHLVHLILYAAMIAMPLLGWLMSSASGGSVPFFGLQIAPIIAPDKELAHTLEEIHEFIGNALYYVIGLHALAALFHHYIVKDNTLLRMVRTSH
ncbi:MAG TPA: cytochrome b [Hyphomicrobium sp.]|nr:cytochrome b [Hyphomicrobium sp.]